MKNYGTSTITEVDNYNVIGLAAFLDLLYSKVTDNSTEIQLTQYTVQPVHTGPCTNRNPVYTVIIIWCRINYTQNYTN